MAGDYTVIDLSGWIFSYKQLGNNLLWFNIAQNINNQSASNRRDQGVKIPFILPFDQHSFGHINVAGYPVGEDIFSFYKMGLYGWEVLDTMDMLHIMHPGYL